MSGHTDAVGLYIHVPFCLAKCDYCAFSSQIPREGDAERFLERLAGEWRERSVWLAGRPIRTVFVGGGNPTALGAGRLGQLLAVFGDVLCSPHLKEWTVESNPETLDATTGAVLRSIPRLRLSLGLQRFRDEERRFLGRRGSSALALEAVERALDLTSRVSLDVMLGLPGFPSLVGDLTACLERFPVEHVSAYLLSAEEGTPLGERVARGEAGDPAEEGPEEWLEVADALGKRGFVHYEISSFARPGRECRHNLLYWHNGDYLGLGPAAVGTLGDRRLANPDALEAWLAGEPGVEERLSVEDRRREMLMLRLRLVGEGLDLDEWQNRFGPMPADVTVALETNLAQGDLKRAGPRIRLTRQGLPYANRIIAALF